MSYDHYGEGGGGGYEQSGGYYDARGGAFGDSRSGGHSGAYHDARGGGYYDARSSSGCQYHGPAGYPSAGGGYYDHRGVWWPASSYSGSHYRHEENRDNRGGNGAWSTSGAQGRERAGGYGDNRRAGDFAAAHDNRHAVTSGRHDYNSHWSYGNSNHHAGYRDEDASTRAYNGQGGCGDRGGGRDSSAQGSFGGGGDRGSVHIGQGSVGGSADRSGSRDNGRSSSFTGGVDRGGGQGDGRATGFSSGTGDIGRYRGAQSNVCSGNRGSRYGGSGNDQGRRYGGSGGDQGDRYGGNGVQGGRYGGNGARGGRGGGGGTSGVTSSGVGDIRGTGYETIGAPIADPRDEEEWTGHLPPRDVDLSRGEIDRNFSICHRPNVAIHPKTTVATANFFDLTLDPSVTEIFKYHIEVGRQGDENDQAAADGKPTPTCPKRPLRKPLVRRIINAAFQQYETEFGGHRVPHDGMAAAYSASRLPWDTHEFQDVNPDNVGAASANAGRRSRAFTVRLQYVETIRLRDLFDYFTNPDANPLPALQALDVAARHLGAQRLIPVGRNFFSMKKTHPLRGGKELCWGYHQAIRIGQKKLLLNMDQAATVFYAPGPLLDLVLAALNLRDAREVRQLNDRESRNLSRALRKIEVMTTHRNDRKKPIMGISSMPANATIFESDGVERSVADYFSQRYGIHLQYPNLPVVNLGGHEKPVWLPIEVCEVAPGQRCANINDLDTAEIIRQTSQRPQVRAENILEHARSTGFENDPYMRSFGVKVDLRMANVEAKVLETPEVQYANVSERPIMGVWSLKDRTFVEGACLRNWGIVVHANVNEYDVQRFVGTLCDIARMRGINIQNRNPLITHQDAYRGAQVEELMMACVRGLEQRGMSPPQLVVVIMRGRSVLYSDIKRTSDTVLGVPCQCLLANNVVKCQVQYCANVCMKINMKLGGKNSILRDALPLVTATPSIMIGASISHPRSGMGSRPSIASVVASLDRYSAKYVARVAAQKASNGISMLPYMLHDLFLTYYQATHRKPEHIVYYRDGVSDGQQYDILQTEMKALRQACFMVSESFQPPVTFIVVNTHHHMRAFGSNRNDCDRSGNIQPGTVIDSGIVHPHRFDFFLFGHSGLQGTSRAAHYTVLHDENRMTAEDVQKLTYSLCYTFARCTRSVSVVPPVYYAQLAATRARCFLNEASDGASTAGSSRSNYEFLDVHKNIQDSMFFM